MVPSLSVEPLPVNDTARGVVPVVGVAETLATGGTFAASSLTMVPTPVASWISRPEDGALSTTENDSSGSCRESGLSAMTIVLVDSPAANVSAPAAAVKSEPAAADPLNRRVRH